MTQKLIITGGLFMLLGVILGAFGAHALKDVLSDSELANWHTAVQYQMIHGLGLIAIGAMNLQRRSLRKWVWICFTVGVFLFCGSLYGLSLTESGVTRGILGPMTPVGGLLFIVGWGLVIRLGVLMKAE